MELGEVEKVDDSRREGGVLELACRTKVAVLQSVFSMDIVDAEGQQQENEEKYEIEAFPLFSRHRIPTDHTISERKEESQSLADPSRQKMGGDGSELDFKTRVDRATWRSVPFDPFVLLIEDVIQTEEKLDIWKDVIGSRCIQQGERGHPNPGRDPVDPFRVLPFPEVDQG